MYTIDILGKTVTKLKLVLNSGIKPYMEGVGGTSLQLNLPIEKKINYSINDKHVVLKCTEVELLFFCTCKEQL